MLIVVCGLIGSGKSTYVSGVLRENETLSDFDLLDNSKEKQLKNTKKSIEKNIKTYHITCFPTQKELDFFNSVDEIKYIWINTELSQCTKNIIKRNRSRDIENLEETIEKNKEIQARYIASRIKFEVINLFETNERW